MTESLLAYQDLNTVEISVGWIGCKGLLLLNIYMIKNKYNIGAMWLYLSTAKI
jgi:hypothetical protein